MSKTALITGASSGIGLELAKIHAKKGGNVVLIARNEEKLNLIKQEIETQYGVRVYIMVKDLSVENVAIDVYEQLKNKHIQIDYLINNAGFGDYGMFFETDWEKEHKMINLNITTLTHLTKLFLKDMLVRGNGKIMNVASTASFQPGPGMAVYYATKAYVLHFTEAIANEVADKGITITALCPGATKSGFQERANMQESKLVKGKKLPTSKQVALYGYDAMLKGKTVAIEGFMNKVLATSVRFIPRDLTVKITRFIQDKRK